MAEGVRSTMDFFAAQAAARRRTGVLVVLFALAWALTVVLADLGIALVLARAEPALRHGYDAVTGQELGPAALLWERLGSSLLPAALGVSAVVLLGTAWHAIQLGGDGGDAVARMMGGLPVDRNTRDPAERRAVNVLEEMALAAAIPVPRLYLLPDEGINAFAAGTTPDRAVVAVTRGALEALSRDQLQGVLAHELSHVLNHDTRLNQRLMALMGGLTVLVLLGRISLQLSGSGRYRSRGRDRSGALFLAVGLVLLVAGAIGAFFGRLIRLAVSRQREFLADAAAVQFTRNPGGLAGALQQIAERGSVLSSPHAPEAAHFFFANGVSFAAGLFSTHPPLEERIRRLQAGPLAALQAPSPAEPGPPPLTATPAALPTRLAGALPLAAAAAAAVGRPAPEHLARAQAALAGFPAPLTEAARQPAGARALSLALLLDADPGVRRRQLAAVGDPALATEAERLGGGLGAVPRQDRLALLDLALPALDALSPAQARALVEALAALARTDGRITLFEWALQRLVRRRLGPLLGDPRPAVRVRALEQVEVEVLELLSALAWAGQREAEPAQRALDAAVRRLRISSPWRILPRDRITVDRLDAVLARLDEAAPPLKAQLLGAAMACALVDGRLTTAEAELLRALAGSLGLPLPGLPAAAIDPAAGAA